MDDAGLSRRAVLGGTCALALAACSETPRPEPPVVDPDVRIRAEVADGVRRLVALYDASIAAHPGLRTELAPLAAETAAHLSALAPPATTGTREPSTTSPSASVPAAPPSAGAAREALARAERNAADSRVTQLASASAALARLIAAIGASEATHATLLRAGR